MAQEVGRGEIWMLSLRAPDHRRPVLVLSRPGLLRVLRTATVASVSSTAHGSPTEAVLGVDEGLKHTSVVNLANLFTVRQADLRKFVGSVAPAKMQRVCEALAIACGCD
jgi:mRNA interferase MazF